MRSCEAPRERAARTKSWAFKDITSERVSRANSGTRVMPIAIMAFGMLGPRMAITAITMRSHGKARMRSMQRMRKASRRVCATMPASRPIRPPPTSPTETEMNPTISAIRVPAMMRASMSRPSWSVPSHAAADGGSSLAAKLLR